MNLSDGTAPPSAKESGSSEPAYYGRGGAGNFRVGEEAERRKKGEEEEREKRERVGEMVRRDVEAGLRRPEGAYLGGKVRLEE